MEAKVKNKVKAEPKYLFTDVASWENAQREESNLLGLFDALKKVSIEVLGDDYDIDHREYLKDCRKYLIDNYFEISGRKEHLRGRAENILISDTGVKLHDVGILHKSFKQLYKSMAQLQPKIQKNGLKSTIYKAQFQRFLDKNKAEHYEAVKKFYDSANALRKFGIVGNDVHLVKFVPGRIWMEGSEATINYSEFVE